MGITSYRLIGRNLKTRVLIPHILPHTQKSDNKKSKKSPHDCHCSGIAANKPLYSNSSKSTAMKNPSQQVLDDEQCMNRASKAFHGTALQVMASSITS